MLRTLISDPRYTIRPLRRPDHAVLSLFLRQHLHNLGHRHGTPLDQADNQAHMFQNRRRDKVWDRGGAVTVRWRCDARGVPGLAQHSVALLVRLAFFVRVVPIISDAALRRSGTPVRLAAPKAATQIGALDVAMVGEKEDPAMHASLKMAAQIGAIPEQSPEHGIIHQHQLADRWVAIPSRLEMEPGLNLGC